MSRFTFTSESVTEGHPDKMADQISDAILDALLAEDPASRVACETLVTTGLCVVAGEITTEAYVDIPSVVRETINDIGYDRESYGFDGNTCGVMVTIDEQSPDIAQGVDASEEVRSGTAGEDSLMQQGAGDQGMMFGYACDETDALMPLPIHLAHRMAERLAEVRKAGVIPYLRPDGKTQVTFDYEDGKPVRLRTVLVSTQHDEGIDRDSMIRPTSSSRSSGPVIPEQYADDDFEVFVNPTGRSSSAARWATPASPGARSSSTPTAAWAATAAGPSRARTPPRSTARPPTPPAGWPRTWWPPAPPAAARCRSPTRSASPVPCRSWWRPSAPARSTPRRSKMPSQRCSTCGPRPSCATSTCAGRSTARRRPTGTSAATTGDFLHLGAHRPGRRPQVGAGALSPR
jgi:hypothetical protein